MDGASPGRPGEHAPPAARRPRDGTAAGRLRQRRPTVRPGRQRRAAHAAAVVRALALGDPRHRLDVPLAAYRPSEPASLLQAPRVILRADLADAGDGHVVVYDAADAAEAQRWAADLAAHLGSGFGQTNFAVDTQFSVAVRDDSVILTTWSSGSSSDPGSAEAFFDAVASVGSPVEVVK